jgi:NADH:ubiquinone oxidoreductase subunit 2 (subunit N)
LAYSSIAHAGFILVGVLAFDKAGVAGVMFYALAYGSGDDRRLRHHRPGPSG